MIDMLLDWDRTAFHWINDGWSNGLFDLILPLARDKYAWLPLYVFCIAWILYNMAWRKALIVFGFVVLGVFAADTISSKLIKYEVRRPRPCQETLMEPPVRLRVDCGSGYSFTSSHATNHFFLAAFLAIVFGRLMGRWRHAWWGWAALVSLAQVYVGVHYPLDVIAGGALGAVIGTSMAILCRQMIHAPLADPPMSG
jgi:undecaprenyl-diphosphatase